MKLREFHDDYWWPNCESRLRECTLAGYRSTWEKSVGPRWGEVDMDDIKPRDVESWLRNTFSKPGSMRNAWGMLRVMLRLAVRYELVSEDITHSVKNLPKAKPKKQPVLDKDEIRELLDGLKGSKIEPFVLVSVTLGLRKEEGCALEWADIDLKSGMVTINKGAQWVNGREVINPPKTKNSYRTIWLPDFALARMQEIHAEMVDSGTLHPRITGELTPNKVTAVYQREIRDRGLPYVPPKNLRHSWATCALRAGVPLPTVSRQLGHYDVSVTANHYVVSSENDFKSAQKLFQAGVAPDFKQEEKEREQMTHMTFIERMKFLFTGKIETQEKAI